MRRASRVFACASLALAHASIAPPVAAQPPEARAGDGGIEAPKLRQFAEDACPPEAEQAGLEGTVVLSLRLDAAGRFTRGVTTLVGPDGTATDEPFGLFTGFGAAAGEARLSAVAHDGRGGVGRTCFDLVFE